MRLVSLDALDVVDSLLHLLRALISSIECLPSRGVFEEPHRDDRVLFISCESMIDSRREEQQISLRHGNAHPAILECTNIEVSRSFHDESHFGIGVEMLLEEDCKLLLIIRHGGRVDLDYVSVLHSDVLGVLLYCFLPGARHVHLVGKASGRLQILDGEGSITCAKRFLLEVPWRYLLHEVGIGGCA
ncbi:hypothetical protein PENTCL1PPCAC_29581, partial [Pristionchus entomophagus]